MDSLGNEKATLKAIELRIGNIVSTDVRYRDIDILILSENDFGNLILFKAWGRIHPVPLTEEWLIKLGFTYADGYYFHNDGDFRLYERNAGIDGRDRFYFDSEYWNPEMEYVHQLQNLYFALIGNELEVNQPARQ